MISRNSFLALILLLLGLGALGCSGGSDLGGLAGAVDDGILLADSRTTGTSGALTSLEGTAIPLADIYVDGELVSFTDENGEYNLNLSPGEHTIAFGYDEFIIHETSVSPNSREVMQFPKPPATGIVAGRVFCAPDPNEPEPPENEFVPLEGAIVLVIDNNTRWVGADVTDEDGRYRIAKAPAGQSKLLVFHRGYLPWCVPMFVNPNTVQYRNVYLREAPHFGHILGLVRDPEFNPIAGAHVVLTKPGSDDIIKHAETTDFGAFLMNKIEPGAYIIRVGMEGYEIVRRPIYVHRGRNFEKFKLFPIDDDGGDG